MTGEFYSLGLMDYSFIQMHCFFSKYFKMLKAKVPPSWVKRVLEVDGKDARVLDLDPDQTLADQLPYGAVDEFGNVDWDKANPPERPDINETLLEANVSIPADTFASVKAELAAMKAKAGKITGGLRKVPGNESLEAPGRRSNELSKISAPKLPPSLAADISSEAIAASHARIDRLNAIRTAAVGGDTYLSMTESAFGDIGRRRESVDEIRRRLPQPTPSLVSSIRSTNLRVATQSTRTINSAKSNGSPKQVYDHLPLKGPLPHFHIVNMIILPRVTHPRPISGDFRSASLDDPRYSKYFQMIRSRVPRSWVERVIEVDDRDPAILGACST